MTHQWCEERKIACRKGTLVLAAGLVFCPGRLPAQITLGTDATLSSASVWRGLTFTNRPVLQPDFYLGYVHGSMVWTAGAWANVELGRYDGPGALSQGGGLTFPDLTEVDWWLEGSRRLGRTALGVGVTGYQYPNPAGMTAVDNTVELYARAGMAGPLNPRAALFWDVITYRGLYLEVGVGHRLRAGRRINFDLGARAGVAVGLDPSPGDLSRYQENGITHLDLSAATSLAAGGIRWTPMVHLILAGDPLTRITGPGTRHDLKLWLGLRAAWVRVLDVLRRP